MATFLDITLLGGLSTIFVFIFMWIAVYGVLTTTKPFGDDQKGLYAFSALALALLTSFSAPVVSVIKVMTPWFIGGMIFVILILMIYFALGYSFDDIKNTIGPGKEYGATLGGFVITIGAIILLSSIGYVFFSSGASFGGSGDGGGDASGDGSIGFNEDDVATQGPGALISTIFHPRILGMIVVLVIGWLTILFLARTTESAAKGGK